MSPNDRRGDKCTKENVLCYKNNLGFTKVLNFSIDVR